MNIQARVALDKVRHPERYCPERRCLWHTGGAYCPRHADPLVPVDRLQEIHDAGSAMQEARTAAGHRPHGARFRERLAVPLYGRLSPSQAPGSLPVAQVLVDGVLEPLEQEIVWGGRGGRS